MDGSVYYAGKRNCNIDLLKIISCIAVVGLHTLQKDRSLLNSTLYYLCGFAVPVFFMCSGYMLLRRNQLDHSYSVRKITAILKLVLAWNAIFAAAGIGLSFLHGNFGFGIFVKVIKDFAKGFLQSGKFWHFWYFGALMILYLIAPLLHKYNKKYGILKLWSIFVVCGIMVQVASYFAGEPLQKYIRQTFRLWTWVQYFELGGVLAEYKECILAKLKKQRLLTLSILLCVIIVIFQNFAGRYILHNLYAEYFYDDLLTMLWCGSIFLTVLQLKIFEKGLKIVANLSTLSLGVYVIHPFLIRYIGNRLIIDTIGASLVYFSVTLLVSIFVVYLIKKTKLSFLFEFR